jgi:CDP-diacylglycerol---serine O-phosphatidyltransferase
MRTHIPNAITLTNLFCGCCAIVNILYDRPETAALFTLGSFLCDYADGMVARMLQVSSPLGKELDSLADVVSFGVAPGMMLFMCLGRSAGCSEQPICVAALPAFVLSMFAAYRLGKFNLDTRQTDYFLGLSTPACTIFVLGLTLAAFKNQLGLGLWLQQNPVVLYGVIACLSWLMVSEIPMFGLKIKRFDLHSNAINLAFAGVLAVLIYFLGYLGLALAVVCYLVLSIGFRSAVVGK